MRKQESDDPLDMISGSTAMQGAVDGFLLLYRKRQETDARLFVLGRDIEEEQELLLQFNKECASWVIKGDAESDAVAGTPQQQEILDELKKHANGLPLKELAERLHKNPNTLRNLLVKLRNDDKILLSNNVYSVVSSSNRSKHSRDSNRSNPPINEADNQAEGYYATTQVTTVDTQHSNPIVTPIRPLVDSSQTLSKTQVTTLTTLTTNNSKPMCNEHKKLIAVYRDETGHYCQECLDSRRFYASLLREYGEVKNYPSLLFGAGTVPSGKEAYEHFLHGASFNAVYLAGDTARYQKGRSA
jgi:hypothetical protein